MTFSKDLKKRMIGIMMPHFITKHEK